LSPEQFVAILGGLAVLLAAVARCIAELRAYHAAVNSKMDALLELTATSSRAEGKLEGRAEPVGNFPTDELGRFPSQKAGKLPLD